MKDLSDYLNLPIDKNMRTYNAIVTTDKNYLVEIVNQEKYAYFYFDEVHKALYYLKEGCYDDYLFLVNQGLKEVTVKINSNMVQVALVCLVKINNTKSFKNIYDLRSNHSTYYFKLQEETSIATDYCISKTSLKDFFQKYLIEYSLWRDFNNRNLSLDTLSFYEITDTDILKMLDIVQTYDLSLFNDMTV
ncbi:hypothetical protein HX049_18110 [Myroides odoratimimus]|uniref:hypothetical protein n=1 Tax=Myroides odoratimimus TaxID=76832 RepID=UPI00257671EB|nr:hypothetical protein [Myroides odoratimimus]MDM1399044.1 hypothetical protein [Myroides odoratimimus]